MTSKLITMRPLAAMRDLLQVLLLDRLEVKWKPDSVRANGYCRTLRFHSRSKIRPLAWRELHRLLGAPGDSLVAIPNPGIELGDVGGADYYGALAMVTKCLQPQAIFEFGTYLGLSALTMAANTRAECRIYTMDLPDSVGVEMTHPLNRTDQGLVACSRHRVGEVFLGSPFQDRITQIRDDSMTFRAELQVPKVDLVFVDGGHSTALIAKDTENAFRILSDQGTILWDDYFYAYPEVVKHLDELANRYPLHGIPGTNLVIYSRRSETAGDKETPPGG